MENLLHGMQGHIAQEFIQQIHGENQGQKQHGIFRDAGDELVCVRQLYELGGNFKPAIGRWLNQQLDD